MVWAGPAEKEVEDSFCSSDAAPVIERSKITFLVLFCTPLYSSYLQIISYIHRLYTVTVKLTWVYNGGTAIRALVMLANIFASGGG